MIEYEEEDQTTAAKSQKQPIGKIKAKIYTLNQFKQIIHEIYTEKTLDDKSRLNHIPPKTLEQFMFTYLLQKYGLKSLSIEFAASIVSNIRVYKS